MAAYMLAIRERSTEALERACLRFLDGKVERDNRTFVPSAEQFNLETARIDAMLAEPRPKTIDQYDEHDWQRALDYCRPRGEWPAWLGPAPFAQGCLVPAHLLAERDRKMVAQGPQLRLVR